MKLSLLSRYLFLSLVITFIAQVNCGAAEDEHTPLGEQMEQIGRAWRMVKRSAGDASKNAQTLAQVKKMQAAAKVSMEHTPDLLKDIPEADKASFLKNYNRGMKAFSAKLDKLATLLESGDNQAATALITEIDDQRKKAHEAFKRPE